MKVIVVFMVLLGAIFGLGCVQEESGLGEQPVRVYNDTAPIWVTNATEVIINFDPGLTPCEIRDAIESTGVPEFVRYSIRNAEPNETIRMNPPPCWGANISAPACPGKGMIILINRTDPIVLPLVKNTKVAGYAGEDIGAVVTTGDVHGDALGMRIVHETEHEVGLPADGMLGECKEKFVKYLRDAGYAEVAAQAANDISTFYMQILFHDWLAETNPENFYRNSL